MLKKTATDALKTSSKRLIQKTAETTGDFIGRSLGVSKNPKQNNSETVTNDGDKEKPKERSTSPEQRQKIIDNLIFNIMV